MIRTVFGTAITLVGIWYAGAMVLARVEDGDDLTYRKPEASIGLPGVQQMPPRPFQLPLATLPGRFSPPSVRSDLSLKVASAPAPRPAKVDTRRPKPRPATARQILQGAAIPLPPDSLRNASDLSCIAVAIYHEARDQEDLGQRAVASVIVQRAAIPHRWGNTACGNIVPSQFSFLTSQYDYPPIDDREAWERAVRFAAQALLEGPMPELKGADHYHATSVSPSWVPAMVRVRLIDDHVFYVDPRSSLSL
ncbi:cell wall hydrolase [Paracoccus sp. WLY502]|uniref:cell wall hydrolase n=1 Tax=Paracoccus yibinensis TaxID=3068891 RepID=UPI0027964A7E|nr:cell wall hydrolase [Paracoccus sp. WLY502]MDQ1898836.1 cell wall hydrolase [Paracoccus sp. WLY502]